MFTKWTLCEVMIIGDFMNNKLVKVKRDRINWVNVLHAQDSNVMLDYYFKLISKKHPFSRRGGSISCNRAAYNTLRHFYSTTTVKELAKRLSVLNEYHGKE